MEPTPDAGPEFSRIVDFRDLGDQGLRIELRATDDECARLARRFGLVAMADLSASARLSRTSDERVRLEASFQAEVTQTCVVSLEPVANRVAETLDIEFELGTGGAPKPDVTYDPSSDREPLTGDSLDLGEFLAEELALALDPYPRKPGVSLEMGPGGTGADGEAGRPAGPFEALAVLKRKD